MIYIVKHKEVDTPKIDGYKDIYVGELCDYLDSDNINNLNNQLSELTAVYEINK